MVVSGVCVCVRDGGGGGGRVCLRVCVCPTFTGFYLGGTLVIVLFLVKNGFRSHCVCVVGGGGGHVVGRGGGGVVIRITFLSFLSLVFTHQLNKYQY